MIKRRSSISGQWSPRLIEMLELPAYRALSRAAHLIISRIEIELGHHGGNDNGRLPVTVDQFVEYGLRHRGSIAPAIREAEALGFIRVTERGRGGNAEHRSPNRFFLTFAHGRDSKAHPPTHEWRRINTVEEAEQIARDARADKDQRAVAHGNRSWKRRNARGLSIPETGTEKASNKNRNHYRKPVPKPVRETGTENTKTPVPETGTTA